MRISPFRWMNTFFLGLVLAVCYGIMAGLFVYLRGGLPEFTAFAAAYTVQFKTVISLGLILGTALVVFRSQNVIPDTIESAFPEALLTTTDYPHFKKRFLSRGRSVRFSGWFMLTGFVIFYLCHFPLPNRPENLMLLAVSIEYAGAVYVGRKLFYAGMMLQSLSTVVVSRNLFKKRELDDINTYVTVASMLTVVFVYVQVTSYYHGPFAFDRLLGESIRPFIAVMAIIATPVLVIFNFYPRSILRRLYSASIDVEIENLQAVLKSEQLTDYEKRSHLIAFDKMSRDELSHSLRLTLSDLPIGFTILVGILQLALK